MNRLLAAVTAGAMVVASQAHADDASTPSSMSKRQMVAEIAHCMKIRLSANKDSSYKEVFKTCRDEVQKRGDTPEPGALVASDPPAHPANP
jgi:hypothetical protein